MRSGNVEKKTLEQASAPNGALMAADSCEINTGIGFF